jgi:hypothetical protein
MATQEGWRYGYALDIASQESEKDKRISGQ